MNRMVGWLALDKTSASPRVFDKCSFHSPHWKPDHQATFIEKSIAFSATQRFITPQCHAALMPYRSATKNCIINADVYLSNRESLCELLNCDSHRADADLLVRAYEKWGEECTQHLEGQFAFIIWDKAAQQLFTAVDHFASCPLFYVHFPGRLFVIANECSPFFSLCPKLRWNTQRFAEFARDVHSQTETAYQEVRKLPAGHQMVVTWESLRHRQYWHWRERRKKIVYRTREEYYAQLRPYFKQAVQKCLRRLGPLTTQLSGGLDSSAITTQAALLLAEQGEALTAFTSVPNQLAGKSYRPGWVYHELPRIESLLAQHPNIRHFVYRATPETDIFNQLQPLQRHLDQPLRNVNNLDWTLACYELVLAQQGRVLLIGAGGNGTISWAGTSTSQSLRALCSALLRSHRWDPRSHETMVSGKLSAPLRASVYALQLWYGVRRLDPTQDLELSLFCYNVPQWIYRKGNKPLQQRLLAREGLSNLLPKAIAQNPNRGEQGTDWYLHYNHHRQSWDRQLHSLSQEAQEVLWQSYDREKIMALFAAHPYLHHAPDHRITRDLCYQLLRCLSMGYFLAQ